MAAGEGAGVGGESTASPLWMRTSQGQRGGDSLAVVPGQGRVKPSRRGGTGREAQCVPGPELQPRAPGPSSSAGSSCERHIARKKPALVSALVVRVTSLLL